MGCAAGAPPLTDETLRHYCGPVSGEVKGNTATFHFPFESYVYRAQVLVEPGAQRMTGTFHGVGPVSWPTAWLRVADGELWLPPTPQAGDSPDPLLGGYRLELVAGGAAGAATTLDLWYRSEGLATGLGSFFHSELRRDEDGTLWAGPVPGSAPELAVSMKLETAGDALVSVQATTGDGHEYVYRVTERR
jgi:hypothetical protein